MIPILISVRQTCWPTFVFTGLFLWLRRCSHVISNRRLRQCQLVHCTWDYCPQVLGCRAALPVSAKRWKPVSHHRWYHPKNPPVNQRRRWKQAMKVVWKPIFPSASSWCLAWPSPQVKFSFKLLGYFFYFLWLWVTTYQRSSLGNDHSFTSYFDVNYRATGDFDMDPYPNIPYRFLLKIPNSRPEPQPKTGHRNRCGHQIGPSNTTGTVGHGTRRTWNWPPARKGNHNFVVISMAIPGT